MDDLTLEQHDNFGIIFSINSYLHYITKFTTSLFNSFDKKPLLKPSARCVVFLEFQIFTASTSKTTVLKRLPLTELTKKWAPEKVKWGEAEEKAFQQLKKDLCSEPVLIPPNPNKPYVLHCDASNVGLGCVLLQRDDSDRERVVSYGSRKLLKRERLFSVPEKECACIVWALTHHEC